MLDCVAIIPARYSSTRLPGKLLKKIGNKSLLQHVYENTRSYELFSQVIVATDDKRIAREVEKFEGNVVVSKKKHNSGSDRIAEITENIETDIFFNIQADEFNLSKKILSNLVQEINEKNIEVATPIYQLKSKKNIFNPNRVKVVIDKNNFALYFSRSVVPYNRNDESVNYWGHIGIYAFRKETLLKFSQLEQSMLERTEKLEQLRLLENNIKIKTVVCDYEGVSIDTMDDLEQARKIYKDKQKEK